MKNDFNQIDFEKMGLYYKIMIIGSQNVGKTQILKRLCNEEFDDNYSPTFGMDFRIQKVYDEKSKLTVKVQIVEVSGKHQLPKELLNEYILDTDCFIGVYDISKNDTVNELKTLLKDYKRAYYDKRPNWYFVGNKCDLKNREVSDKPVDIFRDTDIPLETIGFLEVSAKDNRYISNILNNCVFHERNIKMWKINNDITEAKNRI